MIFTFTTAWLATWAVARQLRTSRPAAPTQRSPASPRLRLEPRSIHSRSCRTPPQAKRFMSAWSCSRAQVQGEVFLASAAPIRMRTGRTFASNSTVGAGLVYGFTDDDGDSWVPFGVAPVSGSSDHETIGSGPYPPGSPFSNVVANKGRAVYYCGQTFPEGGATCQR